MKILFILIKFVKHNQKIISQVLKSFVFVRNKTGKQLSIVGGHTFYCGVRGARTNIWRCTRWGQCKARFIITMSGELVTAQLNHTHEPPSFVIHDGIYYKI
ncbi:unnamed protein product [Parnassius mnemosyne]|uniref:FLYWCH-type domain-containing protein n=1 Tax=Parnassius mnemosyne TaxID=213953 RepID=A0AAV1K9B3_9NEOP